MVTYIPLNDGKFILTHSRDESIMRPIATPPIKRLLGDVTAVFPVDPQGSGTWIGMTSDGRAASLLNGGSRRHKHNPPYKHSRGLIIPAYFKSSGFHQFFKDYNFDGLEPFTMIIIENGKIYELIKEEELIDFQVHDINRPLIRFSYPLYPVNAIEDRSLDFYRWTYINKAAKPEQLFEFHDKNRYELLGIAKYDTGNHILATVSITQIRFEGIRFFIDYYDAVNDLRLFNSTTIDQNIDIPV